MFKTKANFQHWEKPIFKHIGKHTLSTTHNSRATHIILKMLPLLGAWCWCLDMATHMILKIIHLLRAWCWCLDMLKWFDSCGVVFWGSFFTIFHFCFSSMLVVLLILSLYKRMLIFRCFCRFHEFIYFVDSPLYCVLADIYWKFSFPKIGKCDADVCDY